MDSGPASATALNFQGGLASILPAAPLCFVPSTLWVTVTPVLQLQPNTGQFLFSPASSHRDHCPLAQGPFQGKGVAEGRGRGAFPDSQKGHTHTQLEKSERVKGERGLKSTTPLTPRQVALKPWLCLGKPSPASGTLSPGSNLPCNSVLSDPWQATWLLLLVCTEVAMRINEVGRAKC